MLGGKTMRAFQTVLKAFAAVITLVCLLHISLGTKAELLLGAQWPPGVAFDAVLDSQDRFYGAVFFIFACVLWLCANDLRRYAPVLKAALAVFFLGAVARFISFAAVGPPSAFIYFLWAVEVITPPVLWLWMQRCLARTPGD